MRTAHHRRKPAPGLLLDAIDHYGGREQFDRIVMVGNSDDDKGAATAANVEYIDADDLFSGTITITFSSGYPTSWLDGAARIGLKVNESAQRYAELLRARINYERMKVEVVIVDNPIMQNVDVVGTSNEARADIINSVATTISDLWINRSWLIYDNAKAHIDALWAGRHMQQLVIVYSELVTVYGQEEARAVESYLKQIQELYHKEYRFVLGG